MAQLKVGRIEDGSCVISIVNLAFLNRVLEEMTGPRLNLTGSACFVQVKGCREDVDGSGAERAQGGGPHRAPQGEGSPAHGQKGGPRRGASPPLLTQARPLVPALCQLECGREVSHRAGEHTDVRAEWCVFWCLECTGQGWRVRCAQGTGEIGVSVMTGQATAGCRAKGLADAPLAVQWS